MCCIPVASVSDPVICLEAQTQVEWSYINMSDSTWVEREAKNIPSRRWNLSVTLHVSADSKHENNNSKKLI